MNYFVKLVELCALWGANCASMCLSYQPKKPDCLK
ncbi:cyclic lactone autoinducer peptide [Lachnospiraceae bacterium MD308]|nr:cyclic lactone autoinducer peptide [Lachnospiraceae bacterium MD308]